MNNQKKMGNKGFSLVELIVVIAIMAVLVGVLAPQFLRYVEKSRQDGDITSIQQVMTAINTSISDGKVEGNVTITIKKEGGVNKLEVTGEVAKDLADALAESGLSTKMNLKSKGWPDTTITYSKTEAKWTINNVENENKPNTNLNVLDPTATQK